jgi:hypothetical protein
MSHDHGHGRGHAHHEHEHPLPPSGQGTVLLDIGGDVGALVVHAAGALDGVEIELARRGEKQAFVHTEVRERRLPEGSVYAGVFPAVMIGDYTLLGLDGAPDHDLTISSGKVTEISLVR